MYLKALEMQGFKSFPDKTVLAFNSGITGVVGPNGSGKSNISDAIRWVLGEQSTKSLRGSKMEDVIFGGTSIRKPLGCAEVTLRLDNKDRALNCDRDEVTVSRRYYRSGESEYILNGEVVRLKDINELFMDTGLGHNGYSIVSQGRVADLISSKSSQRRDMLEEAAGISHYRYRRLDATRRLEQAQENLVRLLDILAELESRVGPLKNQSEKAKKFLVLAEEKKELEIGLWLYTIDKSKKGLKEQENKLAIASAQYENTEKVLAEIEDEMEDVINRSRNITAAIDELRRETAAVEEEAVILDGRIAVEKNTVSHNELTIDRITKDMEQAADTEQMLDEQISEALGEIEELAEKIKLMNEKLTAAGSDMEEVREENTSYAEKSAELSQKMADMTAQLSEKRIEHTTAVSSIEEINTRIENIDKVVSSRGSYVEELHELRNEKLNELEEAKKCAEELQNSVTGYQMKLQSKKKKADEIKAQMDDINLDRHQKRARIKMLDDLEKSMEGYMGSVRAVIKESQRGALRGIHGTVSQLISVEEKYAVAVETALGASVQHIVTDNENDAKRAIAFLKEKRAGRATFLPISSMSVKPFTEKGLEDCIGYVAMADEILSFEPKYADVIKSQLARCVVAEEIDSAVAIARKYGYRFKIVTLDGQVINAGGSMTGGSRGQNAGFLSRVNEIERLKSEAQELDKVISEKEKDYKLIIEEFASAEADFSGAGADLTRAQEEVIRKEGELKTAESRIENAVSALSELNNEKERDIARIKELSETAENFAKQAEKMNSAVDGLKAELEELQRSREELDSKRENIAKIQSEINMEILAARKDIEAREETVVSLRRRKASHEGHHSELQAEIDELRNQNTVILQKIEELSSEAGQLREKSGLNKDKTEQYVNERNALEAKSAELRMTERVKTGEKEAMGNELARLEERKNSMEHELNESINKLYDEYQLTQREAEDMNIELEDPAKAHRNLQEIKGKIRALGNVNVGAIEEYKEVSERYEYMKEQINDIEQSRDELNKMIVELTSKMAERFREQFAKINTCFGETFSELFNGGKAELVLENPSEILECNINIRVQPPGKNVQNIDLLSGGEKGLSAIALLFAILKVTPAPFCVFDEVEAALDDVNVTRYAKYVHRMTCNTQFILITHRRGTMEESDVLYGVTMQEEGVSKLLELKTAEMAKKLGI